MAEARELPEELALEVKQIVLDALHRSPGMGQEPEPIWELYKPEGVAIVIANALFPLIERLRFPEGSPDAP